jgi:hypothetical protein
MTDRPDKPNGFRPVTNDDLRAAMAARKERQARRNELIAAPSAPFVFAPRWMWRKPKPGGRKN